MNAIAIPFPAPVSEEPPAVTLGELLAVLSELTDDEDEIVATLLHMVEGHSVRLVTEPTARAC